MVVEKGFVGDYERRYSFETPKRCPGAAAIFSDFALNENPGREGSRPAFSS